jgi:hypothetical protein
MNNVTTIEKNGKTYAHFFQGNMPINGEVEFVTKDDAPLQVGMFERKEGYEVDAHTHLARDMHLENVGEFLWIQSGSALVKIYDESWEQLCEHTIRANECAIFLRGGHAVTMLEPTRILEVKQGPYEDQSQKKMFRNQEEQTS